MYIYFFYIYILLYTVNSNDVVVSWICSTIIYGVPCESDVPVLGTRYTRCTKRRKEGGRGGALCTYVHEPDRWGKRIGFVACCHRESFLTFYRHTKSGWGRLRRPGTRRRAALGFSRILRPTCSALAAAGGWTECRSSRKYIARRA